MVWRKEALNMFTDKKKTFWKKYKSLVSYVGEGKVFVKKEIFPSRDEILFKLFKIVFAYPGSRALK